jgi:predicted  nucleic acid-binding Zn-ribbon protein
LQSLDLVMDRTKARLEEIRLKLEDERTLAAARAALEQAEKQARHEDETVLSAEHAVASQQAKLREAEGKLYGGSLHNPKELQDLQRDTEALRRHLATLNDRLLEAMLVQEESEKTVATAKVEAELREAERRAATASLVEERTKLEADVERHALEREPMLAGVPAEDLALYARLRQSSGGVAVAAVVDGACGVCGLVLSASGAQEVRSAAAPLRCRQCGRVLYAG